MPDGSVNNNMHAGNAKPGIEDEFVRASPDDKPSYIIIPPWMPEGNTNKYAEVPSMNPEEEWLRRANRTTRILLYAVGAIAATVCFFYGLSKTEHFWPVLNATLLFTAFVVLLVCVAALLELIIVVLAAGRPSYLPRDRSPVTAWLLDWFCGEDWEEWYGRGFWLFWEDEWEAFIWNGETWLWLADMFWWRVFGGEYRFHRMRMPRMRMPRL